MKTIYGQWAGALVFGKDILQAFFPEPPEVNREGLFFGEGGGGDGRGFFKKKRCEGLSKGTNVASKNFNSSWNCNILNSPTFLQTSHQ
jgi:hypothetical protein